MVRVCDAIMGSGKSSAAINFMNEHPEKKFIYVTPYKDEAWRITKACRQAEFHYPVKSTEFKGSKVLHTLDLVKHDKNVSTTHQAFRFYPMELVDLIREKHYTLIIDENLEGLSKLEDDPDDIQMALDAGYLAPIDPEYPEKFTMAKDVYRGRTHKRFFHIARSHDLIKLKDEEDTAVYYWQISESLLKAFDDVYILTYLFNGQGLSSCLRMYNIPYAYIGVSRYDDGSYHFDFTGENLYIPEYTKRLPETLRVLDHEKLNDIGKKSNALSKSWFTDKENAGAVAQLRKNITNYYTHLLKVPNAQRAWSTYVSVQGKISHKGYKDSFIPFNERATNKYREKTALAYCINVYPNTGIKIFCRDHGAPLNDKLYALSNMIQWIWRSAIRDGKPVTVYVPSSRMRKLLTDWMDRVSKGDIGPTIGEVHNAQPVSDEPRMIKATNEVLDSMTKEQLWAALDSLGIEVKLPDCIEAIGTTPSVAMLQSILSGKTFDARILEVA